jgi:hypothetical protein
VTSPELWQVALATHVGEREVAELLALAGLCPDETDGERADWALWHRSRIRAQRLADYGAYSPAEAEVIDLSIDPHQHP